MRLIAILLVLLSASQTIAASCAHCQATMGLRKSGSYYYCTKHYCVKHKVVKPNGKCEQCDLTSLVARGKCKCHFCDSKAKLVVAKKAYSGIYSGPFGSSSESKYDTYCPDHYCAKHKQAFRESDSGSDIPYCRECLSEKKQELREKIAESEVKLQEAIIQIRDQPLESIFGAPLGGSPAGIIETSPGKSIYEFTPKKRFRDFRSYMLEVQGDKVTYIAASRRFDLRDDAEAEFGRVVQLLDAKYSNERRTRIQSTYDSKLCFYDFGCTGGKNPKQQIMVTYDRIEGTLSDYRLQIVAYLVDDMKKTVQRNQDNDVDAL